MLNIFGFKTNAQIYTQNFDSPDALADMILLDEDGYIPFFPGIGGPTWTLLYNYVDLDYMAVSNCDFVSNDEISDDWMITPTIEIPGSNYFVTFENLIYGYPFWDPYEVQELEVLISTGGSDIGDFTSLKLYDEIPEERTTLAISLNDYAGQSVHLAWRNRSRSFLMVLDNINVSLFEPNNVGALAFDAEHIFPVGEDISPTCKFTNLGSNTINSIDVNYIFDGMTLTETFTNLNVNTLEVEEISLSSQILNEARQYDFTITFSNPNQVIVFIRMRRIYYKVSYMYVFNLESIFTTAYQV